MSNGKRKTCERGRKFARENDQTLYFIIPKTYQRKGEREEQRENSLKCYILFAHHAGFLTGFRVQNFKQMKSLPQIDLGTEKKPHVSRWFSRWCVNASQANFLSVVASLVACKFALALVCFAL